MTAPQLARSFLHSTLETWRLDGFGDIIVLLASELVSNAVIHVARPMTLRISRRCNRIRVEVDDESNDAPSVRRPDATEEHGRGLFLVDALATDWGTDIRPEGKTVWFEVDTTTVSAW
jgi:anti-sigma regulatory factor (Ser/Thr protein kinase)